MTPLSDTIAAIEPVSAQARSQATDRVENLIMPFRALGRAVELAETLAAITHTPHPHLETALTVIFAADHGVAADSVSLYPQSVTGQLVRNYIRGTAGANAMSQAVGAPVEVVDMGVIAPLEDLKAAPRFHSHPIRKGTSNFRVAPAMSREEAIRSLETGIAMAERLAPGMDMLAAGEMGIGNTTSASAILCAMTGIPAENGVGPGTGVGEDGRRRKIAAIREALNRHHPDPADPVGVLAAVGGFEIGGMAGFYLGCARLRKPVVLDGFISGAATLLVQALCPAAAGYLLPSHRSAETAHRAMLDSLGLSPFLDLGFRLGEATGAVLMFPLIRAAGNLLNRMATFEEGMVETQVEESCFQSEE